MSTHDVDVLLRAASETSSVDFPRGWGQGRATFGGLVGGALLARALGTAQASDADVRAMTVNFVGPVEPGKAELACEVLRRGKSVTQLACRLTQPDEDGADTVRAMALVTLGAARESSLSVTQPVQSDERVAAKDVEAIPYIAGLMPEFIAHVDMRLTKGSGPFSGGADGTMHGYMRFREAPVEFGLAHLVTLVDCWPPAPAQMLTQAAPLSSITWTIDFLAPLAASGSDFWGYEVETQAAADGYGYTHALVFGSDGRAVLASHQAVAVFG